MKYRVREGRIVTWPDGSVRASAGQVFDGFDGRGDKSPARARVYLRGFAECFDPAPHDAPVTAPAPPSEVAALLVGDMPAAAPRMVDAAPERKARRKKKD